MNITPRNVFSSTNSDGTKISTEEYDFNTFAQLEMLSWGTKLILGMLILGVGMLLTSIASSVILVIALYNFNGRLKIPHVLGIILSGYFLIDAYNGWLALVLLNSFVNESTINFLIALNVGVLVTHIVLLIFGWNIALYLRKKEDAQERLTSFVSIIAVVLIGTIMVTSRIVGTDKNKGWVNQKTISTQTEQSK